MVSLHGILFIMGTPLWLIPSWNPIHGLMIPEYGQAPQVLTMAHTKNWAGQSIWVNPPLTTDCSIALYPTTGCPDWFWPIWIDMAHTNHHCLDSLRHVLCLNHLKPPLLVLNPHHRNHQMPTVGHHLPHCLRAKTSSRAVLAQILVRTSPEPMGQWINPQLQWNGLECRVNGWIQTWLKSLAYWILNLHPYPPSGSQEKVSHSNAAKDCEVLDDLAWWSGLQERTYLKQRRWKRKPPCFHFELGLTEPFAAQKRLC